MRGTVFLVTGMIAILGAAAQESQGLRPVRDEIGFCWDAAQMARLDAFLAMEAGGTLDGSARSPQPLYAAISPHDDYLYAGRTYYPLFSRLRCREALIIGLTHGTVRKEIGDPEGVLILENHRAWRGLSGSEVAISSLREHLKSALAESALLVSDRAHQLEHSIEALVPWLQHYNPGVQITPVMVTAMPEARMDSVAAVLAGAVAAYLRQENLQWGRDFIVLISSDANHYGVDFNNTPFGIDSSAHARAIAQDQRLVDTWLTGTLQPEKIGGLIGEITASDYHQSRNVLWCGRYSIPFGLKVVAQLAMQTGRPPLQGRLLRYDDTWSGGVLPLTQTGMGLTAPFSLQHWVGFFSVGYY
ncbi:MAG TPA: AmmeMemoRadiSam system protein B [bacterium]|nr:AmmeMemoRadiSam system protein B [bacterium]HQG47050.1 AmmeMemoRadiSam system protein B [bacterium]HQI49828.1 AmmeMemoRadiSam system protein B [bacterium]HQJ66129.1 AmmeMemoRadiSam system protein B [bacterium]